VIDFADEEKKCRIIDPLVADEIRMVGPVGVDEILMIGPPAARETKVPVVVKVGQARVASPGVLRANHNETQHNEVQRNDSLGNGAIPGTVSRNSLGPKPRRHMTVRPSPRKSPEANLTDPSLPR